MVDFELIHMINKDRRSVMAEYCRFVFTAEDGHGEPVEVHRVIHYDPESRFGMNEARTTAFEVLGSLESQYGKGNIQCIMKETQ
jgi:hypothetical protein